MLSDWLKYFSWMVGAAFLILLSVFLHVAMAELFGTWSVLLLMLVVFAIGAYFLARENRKEDGE